jgi:hypothetical protein
MLYYCKGPSTVLAVHTHEQQIDPIATYGANTYVIVDLYGSPKVDPATKAFLVPSPITDQMQADSAKLECRYRILKHVGEQAQRNISAHINTIQTDRMMQAPARPATPQEQADIDTANAIFAWIGRPDGMQGACDALIAAKDMEWYLDVKWPPWNSSWDAFVARF